MLVQKYFIGDRVNVMFDYIENYFTAEVANVRVCGLIFKRYEYFVVSKCSQICKWVKEDKLFKYNC